MPHLSLLTSHFSPPASALLHNSELSLWLSVDPLSDKYPGVSPYVYCANNPVVMVDVDGREGIVVSGGEYDGSRYKYNFIEPAIKRLKELKSAGKDESITWVVMEAGYSNDDIANFKKVADDLGVGPFFPANFLVIRTFRLLFARSKAVSETGILSNSSLKAVQASITLSFCVPMKE